MHTDETTEQVTATTPETKAPLKINPSWMLLGGAAGIVIGQAMRELGYPSSEYPFTFILLLVVTCSIVVTTLKIIDKK